MNQHDSFDDHLFVNSKCDFHTDEIIFNNNESKIKYKNDDLKTSTIEFIDISRCSVYEDLENDSNQIKFYKDTSVQCNLYEELWNQKIESKPIDCNCMDLFLQTLKFSKEIKTENVKLLWNSVENELNCEKIQNDTYINTITKNTKKKRRIRNDNNVKLLNDSRYQCEKCNKICLNLAAYYAHTDSHLEKSSICSKCGINVTSYKMTKNHEKYCTNKLKNLEENENEIITISKYKHSKNKTCTICDRTFEKYVTYMDHMNMHNNCKPYICSCLSKFSHYSNFITHIVKFKCPIQGRIIPKYAPQGRSEKMIEMKEQGLLKQTKRYQCRICGISYARDRYLKHFYENIHLEAEKLWLKKFNINKIFSCSYCNDIVFDNLSDCISHRSKVHRRFPNDEYLKTFEILKEIEIKNIDKNENKIEFINQNYKNRPKRINQLSSKEKYCTKCNKYFVKRITFLDHMHIHTNSYPYICSCGERKRFYQSFLTHIQKNQCKGKHIFPDYAPKLL